MTKIWTLFLYRSICISFYLFIVALEERPRGAIINPNIPGIYWYSDFRRMLK